MRRPRSLPGSSRDDGQPRWVTLSLGDVIPVLLSRFCHVRYPRPSVTFASVTLLCSHDATLPLVHLRTVCYHANQAVPRRTGQHRVRIKPRSRSKQAGFSLSVQLFATSFLPALPTRPLLAALAYADDTKNYREYRAKRQNSLRVHGWHPLSGLPGCDEAPRSSYHARRPCAQPSAPLRQVHRVSGAAT